MKLQTLKEWKEHLGSFGPSAIQWQGRIKKVWQTRTGESERDGRMQAWSFVVGVLEDETGELPFKVSNPPLPLTDALEGRSVTIAARESRKQGEEGRMVGAGVTWNKWIDKGSGEERKTAQVVVTMPADCLVIDGWGGQAEHRGNGPSAGVKLELPPDDRPSEDEYIGTMLSVFDVIHAHLARSRPDPTMEPSADSVIDCSQRLTATAMIGLGRRDWVADAARKPPLVGAPASSPAPTPTLPTEAELAKEDDDIPF